MSSEFVRNLLGVLVVVGIGTFSGYGLFFISESFMLGFIGACLISAWATIQKYGGSK